MAPGNRPHSADGDAAESTAEPAEPADPTGTAEPPASADPALSEVETETPMRTTRRLNPRIRIVWLLRAAVLAGVLAGIAFGAGRLLSLSAAVPEWTPAAVGGIAFLAAGTHAVLRYRYWRFELREDALYLERGVFTRVRTVVPFVRIQHVDSRRGPLERVAGLASCVVYSAGSRGADVRIPGLTPDDADALREDLKRLAIGAEGEDGV